MTRGLFFALLLRRIGELVDVPELVERMEAEDQHVQLGADLAAKLEVDRDRYLKALSPQASRELVERLAASQPLGAAAMATGGP